MFGSQRSRFEQVRSSRTALIPAAFLALLGSFLSAVASPASAAEEATPEIDLIEIPTGEFWMGSPKPSPAVKDRHSNEFPRHKVKVRKFALSRTEVTFDQWDACVRAGGCKHRPDDERWGRGARPVINVNYQDALTFIDWLNRVTGRPFRLPSEAEWEYAARAGSSTVYSFGDDVSRLPTYARALAAPEVSPKASNPGYETARTEPVGQRQPNPWNLLDMHGNVSEWVQDCWHSNYEGAPADGSAWLSAPPPEAPNPDTPAPVVTGTPICKLRVARGGNWAGGPEYQRSAARSYFAPDSRHPTLGFRLALDLP